jgi:uncharacterized protein YjbI with pentapeptide repeats
MANLEHLTKLKEGVEAWNKWWKDKPKIRRDLTEANLRKADLAEANLEAANFTGAGNLEVEQLCEAKTLYKVQLDQELEKQVMGKRPHLLETPKHETGLGK